MAWQDVTNDPGIFTTSSGLVWTVQDPDLITFRYLANPVSAQSMTVALWMESTSLSSTASELRVRIPAGLVAKHTVSASFYYQDNGTVGIGRMQVQAGVNYIRLLKSDPTSSWAVSTNATWVIGEITFETAVA